MEIYQTACPLNCWDQCSFIVKVDHGAVTAIEPNPVQEVTGSFICGKGKQHLKRLNHPLRLTNPLLKTSRGFKRVSWEEALAIAADRIAGAVARHGAHSLLHYYDGGHGGILKNIESRFFSALGGCTEHHGSLCWSAGLAAQRFDFGGVLSHDYADILNSRLVMIWGRNPAATAPHLLPLIRQTKKNGARVILIDPLETATAAVADEHITIKPGTDGALALGMAHVIIHEGLADDSFINDCCSGFEPYRCIVKDYPPRRTATLTGIPADAVTRLARQYAAADPGAILLGYGLQRHSNGGNTIRAIDALGALTGNVGIAGGGVSYANFQAAHFMDSCYLNGEDLAPTRRRYPKPKLASALGELRDPLVEVAYISRANPLSQVGDGMALQHAFQRIPFKVVAEHFMTDTAAAADLVLPATFFLEEEDIYFNSMNHRYLSYGAKVVEPPGECRHEYRVMQSLARALNLRGFPSGSTSELLERILRPLTDEKGVTLNKLKFGPLLLPGSEAVAWSSRRFDTADGKYNFYSPQALAEGCDPLPYFHEPQELGSSALRETGYRYWFATPHPAESIHSAHRLPLGEEEPLAYLHPDTGRKHAISTGDKVKLSSLRGSITATAKLSKKIPPWAVVVYEGWWETSGAAVNQLTPGSTTDMGDQASLYDCLCRIEKQACASDSLPLTELKRRHKNRPHASTPMLPTSGS